MNEKEKKADGYRRPQTGRNGRRPPQEERPDYSGLDTFGTDGGRPPDNESVWKLYARGLDYNAAVGLNETVRTNENFFVGR